MAEGSGSVVSIFYLGVFAFIYLIALGLATENEASWNESEMDRAIIVINCPFPIQDGRATNFVVTDGNSKPIPPTFDLATGVNGTGSPTTDSQEIVGSRFECFIQGGTIAQVTWWLYQKTEFSAIPTGWFLFAGDSITSFFGKFYAYLVLAGNYFSIPFTQVLPNPTTTILGFSFGDIHPTAQYIVTGISLFCIVSIVAMAYKILSPYTDGGSK